MGQGQGSITVNQKAPVIPIPGPPGPPFALNSADNGTSIDPVTGRIVLGQAINEAGDPARLLSDREIPLNAFNLHIGVGDTAIWIEEPNQFIGIGDTFGLGTGSMIDLNTANGRLQYYDNNGTFIDVNPVPVFGNRYRFGDMDGINNNQFLDINDSLALSRLGDANDNLLGLKLEIDNTNGISFLGDVNDISSGLKLEISDNNQYIILGAANGTNNGLSFWLDDAGTQIQMYDNNGTYFDADISSDRYQFGDVGVSNAGMMLDIRNATSIIELGDTTNSGNGTNIDIDDANQRIRARVVNSFLEMLDLDGANRIYRIGEFDNGNDKCLRIDQPNDLAQIILGNRYLDINVPGLRYQFGDVDQVNNNTRLDMNGAIGSAIAAIVVGGNPLVEAFEVGYSVEIGDVGNLINGTKIRSHVGSGVDTLYQNQIRGLQLDMINSIHRFGISNIGFQPILVSDGGASRMFTEQFPQMIGTSGIAFTNGAGALVGTLNNSPVVGNPTKWIPINDNGTTRHIPAW